MASLKDLSSVWNNIKEIDLKPIRDSATAQVKITIVGAPGTGKHTLADQMRSDPARPEIITHSPVTLMVIDPGTPLPPAHLTILMVNAASTDFSIDQDQVKKWSEAGKNVLVFINKVDLLGGNIPVSSGQGWMASRVLLGSANNTGYLRKEFVPAVLEMLPQQHLALGRQFPLFRLAIANELINETCFSNAAYSFSTGLAEIVPVLDLPLNLTDLIVLTKSQAFLAYKVGLVLGFSTRWQDYVTEFGGVIGSGFVWRQAARSLVGLVPGWGIIPKVAIAYSGTYVVGHAILGWYISGRHLTSKQLRELSVQAFARGKEYARRLGTKIPKRRLLNNNHDQAALSRSNTALLPGQVDLPPDEIVITKLRETGEVDPLPAGEQDPNWTLEGSGSSTGQDQKKSKASGLRSIRKPRFGRKAEVSFPIVNPDHVCRNCGKSSSADAAFCQYCGVRFDGAAPG